DSKREVDRDYIKLKNIVVTLYNEFATNNEINTLMLNSILYKLFAEIKENYTININLPAVSKTSKYYQRIIEIHKYIENNFFDNITIDTLANSLYLSTGYVRKFIQKHFGISFITLLNNIRLAHAKRGVLLSNESITNIALKSGFSSINSFINAFKKAYGISPGKLREDAIKHSCFPMSSSPEDKTPISVISHIKLSNKVVKNIDNHLCKMVNIENAKNLLIKDFRDIVLDTKKTLNFTYTRIKDLISYSLVPKDYTLNVDNFMNIEKIFDFLYQNDFIPFIELSKSATVKYKNEIPMPSKAIINENYFELLNSLLSYFTGHYPMSWCNKWIFELWKSPNETIDNYMTNYRKIKKLIQSYIPDAKIGGIGFNITTSIEHIRDILQSNPDILSEFNFVSTTANCDTKDPDFITKKSIAIKNELEKYTTIPYFITEFDSLYLHNLPIQQTCFQGTFICKTLLELYDVADIIGYSVLCDKTFSSKKNASNLLFYWGRGLIDKDGIYMPSYYALKLLVNLGKSLIYQGKNYIVTKSEEDHYQILTFNYAHFNNAQIETTFHSVNFEDTYNIFQETNDIDITFEIAGVKPGIYKVSRYLLDRYHGSMLDILIGGFRASNIERLDYFMDIKLPSRSQISYYKNAIVPEERTIFESVNDTLKIQTEIKPHNICMWDITKFHKKPI
ncbi:MAG: helix-turn-helix domain-containing protein, partial [Lachnospiraceae bacterium]|nr:helix-turn-helix domain-containing protein [Lachnospiraceae bacterium]